MTTAFDPRRLDTVHLVPPTPFSDDGSRVVPDRLGRLVADLAERGLRVFLPAAGTGEFHSLVEDEVLACVRVTRDAAGPGATVLAPIGFGLAPALALGRGALQAGADALLVMPPIHPYLSDAGFRDYVRALVRALGVPLLTYKRGPVPSDHLLRELAGSGDLIGVKYAVNNLDAVARLADALPEGCGLYCGTAERWAPYFALAGATGYTSGSGCLAPRLTLALHRSLREGRWPEAMRLVRMIRPLEDFRARDGDALNIGAVKSALGLVGHDFGSVRPPQRPLTEDELGELRRTLEPVLDAEARLSAPA